MLSDPLFADDLNGNFRLTAASPAIDTGTADNAPDADRDEIPRPRYGGILI